MFEALFRYGTSFGDSSRISHPPAQEIRPLSSGRGPVERGEEVGIIHRALSTAPLRKLERKAETIQYLDCQPEHNNKDTNLGICDVIGEYGKSASGDLSKRRVAKAELLDQESVVTEQVGCALCARKRSNWIRLLIVGVMLWDRSIEDGMDEPNFRQQGLGA